MPTPNLWNERFDNPSGYDQTWIGGEINDGVGGASIDEDALSSDVSSPAGWGPRCLKCVTDGDPNVFVQHDTPTAWTGNLFFRVPFVVTSHDLASGNSMQMLVAWNTDFAKQAFYPQLRNVSGTLRLRNSVFHDGGAGGGFNSTDGITLNQAYLYEMNWNIIANTWDWRIDGVGQSKGTGLLTSTHATEIGEIRLGAIPLAAKATTVYYGPIGVGNEDWLGPLSAGSPWYAYAQM